MAELLRTLVRLGEKAGVLARIIRAERALFELLVEEKTGDAKNKRFIQDFKTLADVLIQEMIRHDVGVKFPGLETYVYGEESNKFTNMSGESVEVSIQSTPEATQALLTRVLDGNETAAGLLAHTIHHHHSDATQQPQLTDLTFDLDMDDVGIWIDPIDSTAEYIRGLEDMPAENGVYRQGLQCAVVLIGAFSRKTGSPIMGIINQPFGYQDPMTKIWTGQCFWGVSRGDFKCHSLPSPKDSTRTPTSENGLSFVMSASEDAHTKDVLLSLGKIHYASGAGYKLLCVIEGHVDAYILTKDSTFKWDTCGPQAILSSLGGGILRLGKWKESPADVDQTSPGEALQLKYDKPDDEGVTDGQRWANTGGIVAFRSQKFLPDILAALKK